MNGEWEEKFQKLRNNEKERKHIKGILLKAGKNVRD